MTRELIVGYIEVSETRLVKRRNRTSEEIVLNIERVKTRETEQRARDSTGQSVTGEENGFQSVKRRERLRELAGEVVIVEKNRFQINQTGEIRD